MTDIEELFNSIYEHLDDKSKTVFIEEPEEVEILSEKDIEILKKDKVIK